MINKPTFKQLQKIPNLYSQENVKDKKIYMKFFVGPYTWYVAEINHETTPTGYTPYTLFFTYKVDERTQEGSWGYTPLDYLLNFRIGPFEVDRDLYEVTVYSPKKMSEIKRLKI